MVLSFSKLSTFRKCPRMYHYIYNEKMIKEESGAMQLGSQVHRFIAGQLKESEVPSYAKARAMTLQNSVNELGIQILQHDVPFSHRLSEELIIEGAFDAIGTMNGEEVVIEFKTGRKFDELQPELYSIVSHRPTLVITPDEVVPYSVPENESEIIEKIKEIAQAIKTADEKKEYTAISGEHCTDCPGVMICPIRQKLKEEENDPTKLLEEYMYLKALEDKLKEYLLNNLNENQSLKAGRVIARKEVVTFKKLIRGMKKEEIFKLFDIKEIPFEAIDSKALQDLIPKEYHYLVFDEVKRTQLKISEE